MLGFYSDFFQAFYSIQPHILGQKIAFSFNLDVGMMKWFMDFFKHADFKRLG